MKTYGDAMRLAYEVALESPDPSTQNGAVIIDERFGGYVVLSTGCNTFPPGVEITQERLNNRDQKLHYIEHAERNAIFRGWRMGLDLRCTTMAITWEPCSDCARTIIAAGIRTLIVDAKRMGIYNKLWQRSFEASRQILLEGDVEVVALPGFYNIDILVSGQKITV